ncbi:hypothetical protein NPIL_502391, partial [Nephila pilipes]
MARKVYGDMLVEGQEMEDMVDPGGGHGGIGGRAPGI